MAQAERLFLLPYGGERVSRALLLPGADAAHLYWEPLVGLLVETAAGWVLFDTGTSRRNHNSAVVEQVYRGDAAPATAKVPWHLLPTAPVDRATWGLPGDPLVAALRALGLMPGDLALAVLSHLHWEHTGGIPTLTEAGVEVLRHARRARLGTHRSSRVRGRVRRRLLVAARNPVADRHCRDRGGARGDGAAYARAHPWSGLTAGRAARDRYLALHHRCNRPRAEPPRGRAVRLLHRLEGGGRAAHGRVVADAARPARVTDARLIPGHDQVVLTAIRHPRRGHR